MSQAHLQENEGKAAFLREIGKIITRKGWCKEVERDREGHVCLMGACSHWAFHGDWHQADRMGSYIRMQQAKMALGNLLLDVLREDPVYLVRAGLDPEHVDLSPTGAADSVVNFNDHPETTLEDVQLVLKLAEERIT